MKRTNTLKLPAQLKKSESKEPFNRITHCAKHQNANKFALLPLTAHLESRSGRVPRKSLTLTNGSIQANVLISRLEMAKYTFDAASGGRFALTLTFLVTRRLSARRARTDSDHAVQGRFCPG